LTFASHDDHLEVARLLLDKGANANVMKLGKNDYSTLMLTCNRKKGYLEMARLLIDKGANVNAARKSDGYTALMYACEYGHLEIARLFIDKGADLNAARTKGGYTPLMWASKEGHLEIARLLIAKGANMSVYAEEGFNALIIASLNDQHGDIVQLLIDNGADVNAVLDEKESDSDGYTALMAACERGRLKAAKILIKKGADVLMKTLAEKKTALMFASSCYVSNNAVSLKLVKHLLKNGADRTATDSEGKTAYFYAARFPDRQAALK